MMELEKKDVITWGQTVLEEEAAAIKTASNRLDQNFFDAVKTVLQCKGKLISTGLGKSGYIARKMASTLASTGTSSFYLHPAEALHGDFGMISQQDCLVAIAYGGETKEVLSVSKFASEIGVPVIAITGKKDSSLAKLADFVLDGSVAKEADSLGVAPTASSTVALSLADALAVAVMRSRGFTKQDFAKLHPGGSLGRSLSLVDSYMKSATDLPRIKLDDTFHQILKSVTNPNYGIVALVDDKDHVVGAISDGDLRRALLKHGGKALEMTAKDFGGKKPKLVKATSLILDSIQLMEDNKITDLFVVDDDHKYVGLLRMHDLLASKII